MHQILSTIYSEDIYAGFVPIAESISGWGGNDKIFGRLIKLLKPKVIFEVGTWKGQSAITMAEACKALGLQCPIVCVDTWLGSDEHILQCKQDLKRVNGFPMLYYQFLSNVIHRGVQEWIVPLPATSLTAAKILNKLQIRADLIYIDADHQYESVLADLKAYVPLLAGGGTLFGHDYRWESVRRAVQDFCRDMSYDHTVEGDFWILRTVQAPAASVGASK
jgi:predicted O-methyltransferase YrrM